MQPQTTLPYSAGQSGTIDLLEWQLVWFGAFGNRPTFLVTANELDDQSQDCQRDEPNVTVYRYYSDYPTCAILDRVRIVVMPGVLDRNITLTIK